MTDAEYQQLYEGNKMSAKDKLEWEAYQDWQTYIQNAMAGNTEIIDLFTKDKVFTIDDNLPKKNKFIKNAKNEVSSLTSTAEDRNFVSDMWNNIKLGLDSKVTNKNNLDKASLLTNLKNVTLKQNEHPGFQFHSAGTKDPKAGYYSVDETLPFWQTDAGYEKAMQTWGHKPGWVRPGFRPKKRELDIEAIKSWFKPSK